MFPVNWLIAAIDRSLVQFAADSRASATRPVLAFLVTRGDRFRATKRQENTFARTEQSYAQAISVRRRDRVMNYSAESGSHVIVFAEDSV